MKLVTHSRIHTPLVLGESQEIILDQQNKVHNRYLLLYKLLQNRNKQMAILFDGHSMSKAQIRLMLIRREGLVDQVLLAKLSDKLSNETDPAMLGKIMNEKTYKNA